MKSRPPPPEAKQEPRSSPSDRKRKRSSHQLAPVADSLKAAAAKQQTIQDLFSTRQKPATSSPAGIELTPNSKRSKQKQTDSEAIQPSPTPSLSRDTMYTFTSKPHTGDVVDLTKSPPRNGQPRRMSMIKPVKTTMNPGAGPKKLVVKNLRKDTTWDGEKYFAQIWTQLDSALTVIFDNGIPNFSMEELYRGVENLCRQGKAAAVSTRLDERCLKHFKEDVRTFLLANSALDNVAVLRAVLASWSSWNAQMVC